MVFTFQPPFWAGLSGYVAELGSAMLMADLGLACVPRPDHAAYVASWLTLLKHDPRAICTAAARAQVAADWIHAMPAPPLNLSQLLREVDHGSL